VAWPGEHPVGTLDALLRASDCAGVALTGTRARRPLGVVRGGAFAERIRAALDPDRRFAG
jgi:hypothetical protein